MYSAWAQTSGHCICSAGALPRKQFALRYIRLVPDLLRQQAARACRTFQGARSCVLAIFGRRAASLVVWPARQSVEAMDGRCRIHRMACHPRARRIRPDCSDTTPDLAANRSSARHRSHAPCRRFEGLRRHASQTALSASASGLTQKRCGPMVVARRTVLDRHEAVKGEAASHVSGGAMRT